MIKRYLFVHKLKYNILKWVCNCLEAMSVQLNFFFFFTSSTGVKSNLNISNLVTTKGI